MGLLAQDYTEEAQANYAVGLLFSQDQDYQEAFKWFTKAAEQGHAGAQLILGVMYYNGKGVPQDYKEAVRWFTRSAEQGNAEAQAYVSRMYYYGQGVPEDYVQAYKWCNLAAARGFESAKEARDMLRKGMSPAQIAEAQRLSREFRPRMGEHAALAVREPASKAIKSNGTGFFITADGYLLTAYHVVKEAATLQVWTDGRLIPARLVRVDAVNDIALLKLDGLKVASLPVISSRDVRTGLDVFTLGFPNIQLQGTEVKYTHGNISSLTGAGDDPRLFQISVPVQPGNSGGPLLDEQGQVIGVVIAKLDEISTARATGSLPQNVNYALKSSLVLSFLESLPELSIRLEQTKNKGLSRTQVVKQSDNAVVMVFGY
jgi:S1-C subfamily serine protease